MSAGGYRKAGADWYRQAVDTGGQRATVDARLAAALAGSTLGELDDARREALLVGSARRRVPAGTSLRREGTRGAHLELVIEGFVRVYLTALDGRTLTVRYARPGALFGAVSLFLTIATWQGLRRMMSSITSWWSERFSPDAPSMRRS